MIPSTWEILSENEMVVGANDRASSYEADDLAIFLTAEIFGYVSLLSLNMCTSDP